VGGGGGCVSKSDTTKQTAESTNKGLKDVAQTQQQRPNLPTVVLTWHVSKYKVHKLHQRYILCDARVVFEDVLLVEFMYLVFTCMSGDWCCSWLWSSLLCLWDIFWEPTPLFVDCIYHSWHSSNSTLWPILYKKQKQTGAFEKLVGFVSQELENLEQNAYYLRNVMPLFFVWNVLSSHVSQKANDSELSDYPNWSQQASHLWMWIG